MRKVVLFKLKDSGMAQEYKYRHDHIWPEVIDVIRRSGIKNYSIWNIGDLLVGYYEIENDEKDKQSNRILLSEPKFLEWRKYMEDIIYIDDQGEKEYPMNLVFLMEF